MWNKGWKKIVTCKGRRKLSLVSIGLEGKKVILLLPTFCKSGRNDFLLHAHGVQKNTTFTSESYPSTVKIWSTNSWGSKKWPKHFSNYVLFKLRFQNVLVWVIFHRIRCGFASHILPCVRLPSKLTWCAYAGGKFIPFKSKYSILLFSPRFSTQREFPLVMLSSS